MLRFGFVSLLACGPAQATALPDTLCGTNPVICKTPQAQIQFDYLHGRVLVTQDGSLYDSGLYAVANGARTFTVLVSNPEGAQLLLTANFRTWSTTFNGRIRTQHWELTGGDLQ